MITLEHMVFKILFAGFLSDTEIVLYYYIYIKKVVNGL